MLYQRFYDVIAYIMAPARLDGTGWGRQEPSAPPPSPSASPSPTWTCWGRGLSWTATAWIQCMDLLQSRPPSFKFKVEIFNLDVTSSSNLWTAVHHWHICSHLAQVGHLVVAGLQHCAQDWVTDSHTLAGLPGPLSPPGRLGFTVSLAQPDSSCDWQMAVVYKISELVHVTARALIIEIQLHRAPLQIT